jgi:hypothetical protein
MQNKKNKDQLTVEKERKTEEKKENAGTLRAPWPEGLTGPPASAIFIQHYTIYVCSYTNTFTAHKLRGCFRKKQNKNLNPWSMGTQMLKIRASCGLILVRAYD